MSGVTESVSVTPLRDEGHDAVLRARAHAGWISAGARRIGVRHQLQGGRCEDAISACAEHTVSLALALADGVSGGARGDVAAQALVDHAASHPWSVDLCDWLQESADAHVGAAISCHTSAPGATTFAATWLDAAGQGLCTRVGDCRIYLWQHDDNGRVELRQLIPDQTLAYMGYVPPSHPKAHNPAHMAGNGNLGQLEWVKFDVPPGAGVLLCSDGLHGVLAEDEIAAILEALPADTVKLPELELLCRALIDLAQSQGSEDDLSILLAQRQPLQESPKP